MNIDKNVKMELESRSGRPLKYPFSGMEVGDSFIAADKYTLSISVSVSNSGRQWAKRSGNDWKFATRKVDDGIRVWRTK